MQNVGVTDYAQTVAPLNLATQDKILRNCDTREPIEIDLYNNPYYEGEYNNFNMNCVNRGTRGSCDVSSVIRRVPTHNTNNSLCNNKQQYITEIYEIESDESGSDIRQESRIQEAHVSSSFSEQSNVDVSSNSNNLVRSVPFSQNEHVQHAFLDLSKKTVTESTLHYNRYFENYVRSYSVSNNNSYDFSRQYFNYLNAVTASDRFLYSNAFPMRQGSNVYNTNRDMCISRSLLNYPATATSTNKDHTTPQAIGSSNKPPQDVESDQQLYTCLYCDYKTKTQTSFVKHYHTRHAEGASRYTCDLCPYTAFTSVGLLRHKRKDHSLHIGRYRCTRCDFSTDQKLAMQKHRGKLHGSLLDPYKDGLMQQIIKDSNHPVIYTCGACSWQTKSQHVYDKHVLKHRSKVMDRVAEIDDSDVVITFC